jgi:hypothetical protein
VASVQGKTQAQHTAHTEGSTHMHLTVFRNTKKPEGPKVSESTRQSTHTQENDTHLHMHKHTNTRTNKDEHTLYRFRDTKEAKCTESIAEHMHGRE